ncbi:hypothetical protein LTR84_002408 [Exophiala bonariae]|uniref:Fungal N-terminal domain-containing protein n=1 Tax=Exophiala bonariae TaxID=1690606 RepID=A0AAV9N9F2_9EURO|nr:hypothetical protein LTR84_002408 [Exophiala bonariae]
MASTILSAAHTEKLNRVETGDAGFSRLEATLVTSTEVVPRPNSKQMNDVSRHAQVQDHQVQAELDFDWSLDSHHYPLADLRSLQQVFDSVQCHKHFRHHENFAAATDIECLEVTSTSAGMVLFLCYLRELTEAKHMWTQINKVDDQLSSLQSRDRAQLSELTKQLQVISQNADSHIGNADVCIITATGIRDAHARLFPGMLQQFRHQQVRDSVDYVIDSMRKQKIWFLNYKNRKDSTMSLVYNLVTQQDAANNI